MPILSKTASHSDYMNQLKHDPVYRAVKKDVLSKRSWATGLFHWAERGNTLSKICRWACLFFTGASIIAEIHDAIKSKEIRAEIADETFRSLQETFDKSKFGLKQNVSSIRHDSIANQVIHQYSSEEEALLVQIDGDKNPMTAERSAAFFSMLNQEGTTGYADIESRAIQRIQKDRGLDNLTLEPMSRQRLRSEGTQAAPNLIFEQSYEILQNGRNIGTLTIVRNFSPNSDDKISFNYTLDETRLQESQQTRESIDRWSISKDTSKKYGLGDKRNHQTGLLKCTKDFIKSQYDINCKLTELQFHPRNNREYPGLYHPLGVYDIIDPKSQRIIGQIRAEGYFHSDQSKHNQVNFEVHLNNHAQQA